MCFKEKSVLLVLQSVQKILFLFGNLARNAKKFVIFLCRVEKCIPLQRQLKEWRRKSPKLMCNK